MRNLSCLCNLYTGSWKTGHRTHHCDGATLKHTAYILLTHMAIEQGFIKQDIILQHEHVSKEGSSALPDASTETFWVGLCLPPEAKDILYKIDMEDSQDLAVGVTEKT